MSRSGSGKWDEVAAPQLPDFAVTEVATVPGRPEMVLAATRGDGMWVSNDAGRSFVKPNRNTPGPNKLWSLTVDPVNPNRVYAGAEPIQLWVTDDLGKTWDNFPSLREHPAIAPVTFPAPGTEQHLDNIQIDSDAPDTWYLALQVGRVIRTTDAGKTWIHCEDVDPDTHRLAIDPDNHRRLLAATGGERANEGQQALYLSEDGAESWTPVAVEFGLDFSIDIKPFAAYPGVWISAMCDGPPPAWDREDGARGVMVRSEDGGKSWAPADTSAIEGFSYAFPYTYASSPDDPDTMFAGMNDGRIIETNDGGLSWTATGIQVEGIARDITAVAV
jgi:photosystem II stability/assembly factor-like uncharacterized protein